MSRFLGTRIDCSSDSVLPSTLTSGKVWTVFFYYVIFSRIANLIFVVLDIRTADADVHDPSSSMHAWDVFTRRFNEGAARFRERHGTIPVLVIDHVNILASTPGSPDEATLRVIQATAKSWADQGVAKVVLIASPGRTEQVLSGVVWL